MSFIINENIDNNPIKENILNNNNNNLVDENEDNTNQIYEVNLCSLNNIII